MQKDEYDPSNWNHRLLCSDGNCIGIIIGDGKCSICGLRHKGELPFTPSNEGPRYGDTNYGKTGEITVEEFEGIPPYGYRVVTEDIHGKIEIISGPANMTGDYPTIGYAKQDGLGVALCLVANGMARGRKVFLRIEDSRGKYIDVFDSSTGRWDWDGLVYEDGGISAYESIKRVLYP